MFKDNLVWISTSSDNYFRVIKKISYIGVNVLNVKINGNKIYLLVSNDDYKKIGKYLVSYEFKICKHTGIRAFLDKVIKARIFFISLFIGVLLFLVLSNMVFKINVIHENASIRELIYDELDAYGIKILSFKKDYKKLNEIRGKILDKYPDRLDWMEFDVRGSVIDVRVEERIITDISNSNNVCDIVATKSGVISDIIVYKGEAKVLMNDYVREGDVLISGSVMYNEEEKASVCASGKVFATTWYTVNLSIPFLKEEREETGKRRYNLVWENESGKKEILRSRFNEKDVNYKLLLDIFGRKLYLAEEKETKKNVKKYSEDEVLNAALEEVNDKMKEKLGAEDAIIDKKVLQKNVFDSKMDIDVFVVVRELISTDVIRKGMD